MLDQAIKAFQTGVSAVLVTLLGQMRVCLRQGFCDCDKHHHKKQRGKEKPRFSIGVHIMVCR